MIEYRRQSVRGRLLMSKKFCKFYINRFRPLSQFEEKEQSRARSFYRGSVVVCAMTFGFFSYRTRKAKFSQMQPHEAPRDMHMLTSLINDLFAATVGYMFGHMLSCDYIYKHRQYIIERLHFERENHIDRSQFDLSQNQPDGSNENKLLPEYPWHCYVTLTDAALLAEKEVPEEVKEHLEQQRKKVERFNEEVKRRQSQREKEAAKNLFNQLATDKQLAESL